MSKRPNLAAALHDAGARPAQGQNPAAALALVEATVAAPVDGAPVAKAPAGRAPSRAGQRAVTLYVRPEAHKQLRLLAVDAGSSVQDLMTEALNDLFRKHGRTLIA
jgi:hypothetical protein